jgi:hypothetical protein
MWLRCRCSGLQLLECHHAAQPHVAQETPQHTGRLGEIHEHEATDQRVHWLVEGHVGRVGSDEIHVREPGQPGPLTSQRDRVRGLVNADYRALRD